MRQPTFQEQFDKITKAYYKNELSPYDACACFVGNLLNNSRTWIKGRSVKRGLIDSHTDYVSDAEESVYINSNDLYSLEEVLDLEKVFLNTLEDLDNPVWSKEDRLFKAMEVTLEALKELHISKGEVIQDYNFTKRELNKQLI